MKPITEKEARELISRRYPDAVQIYVDPDGRYNFLYAIVITNGSCVDRVVIDRDDNGEASLWIAENASWSTYYRREI